MKWKLYGVIVIEC